MRTVYRVVVTSSRTGYVEDAPSYQEAMSKASRIVAACGSGGESVRRVEVLRCERRMHHDRVVGRPFILDEDHHTDQELEWERYLLGKY